MEIYYHIIFVRIKRFLVIILIATSINSCKKQKNTRVFNCSYTQHIYNSHYQDALYLYVNDIYSNSLHPNHNNSLIDQRKVQHILGQFQTINDLQIPEIDTIFNILQIKSQVINTHSIALKVDANAPEIQALINGQPTGNSVLDNIISQYHFNEINTAYSYPDFNWLTIKSTENWNIIPIIEQLQGLSFIYTTDGMHFGFDDTGIYKTIHQDYTEYDFIYGWGDCPAGCINKRHWIFRVSNATCDVRFIKSYGDHLP